MKIITIYLEENKIEFFNSILGKEIVKVNDQVVSSKFSMFGTEHIFKIVEKGNETECIIISGYGMGRFVIDFYKDNKPVIESPTVGCLVLLFIVIGIIVIAGLLFELLRMFFLTS